MSPFRADKTGILAFLHGKGRNRARRVVLERWLRERVPGEGNVGPSESRGRNQQAQHDEEDEDTLHELNIQVFPSKFNMRRAIRGGRGSLTIDEKVGYSQTMRTSRLLSLFLALLMVFGAGFPSALQAQQNGCDAAE